MPDAATLALFAASSLAILAIPGPTMLYVLSRTVEHGRGAGLVSVAGVQTGTLLHVAAAVLGLSAALASSATAMTVVQIAGAAYLASLGVQRLRASATGPEQVSPVAPAPRTLFWQGVLVDALNPKTAIFLLAFLPQFVDPAHGPVTQQIAVLGVCFTILAALSDGACTLAAGALRGRLLGRSDGLSRMNRVTGVTLIGMAALTAFAGH